MLAIPPKRFDRALVTYLTEPEVDALLAARDQSTWTGRRDHALLLLAVQTGLRVSELTGLTRDDVHLGAGAHVTCHGKGRKDRITPLTSGTVAVLRAWLAERAQCPTRRCSRPAAAAGSAATRSSTGSPTTPPRPPTRCPSLHGKTITAHVLRHTAAMRLLHAGVDTTVIALWLGHESVDTTQIYLHADLALKEKALARTRPPTARPAATSPPTASSPSSKALIMPTSPAPNPCPATDSPTTSA